MNAAVYSRTGSVLDCEGRIHRTDGVVMSALPPFMKKGYFSCDDLLMMLEEAGGTIPKHAFMQVSVKGQTTEICDYMREHAFRIIKAACEMYDVTYKEVPGKSVTDAL